MSDNALRTLWEKDAPAFGGWLSIPNAFSAELVARQGFDYVCVDLQHGLVDRAGLLGMLQAIGATDAVPLVRVPSNDFAAINFALDCGALGVVVPLIESADDARSVVAACRYPPQGARSFGPTRAGFVLGRDYFARANELVCCIPMIETRRALDSLDEILSVPGVDAVYVGPNDLSLALGQGPGLHNEAPYRDAHAKIAATCRKHGVTAGIHGSAQLARTHVDAGYRMITVSSDVGALAGGAARDLRTARSSD